MSARWRVNRSEVAKAAVRAAGAKALEDAVEFLGEEADRTAPIEEGTLIRSRTSTVDPQKLRGAVAYDTPYAARQHEDMTFRHDPGRRAKWLEQTLKEQGERAIGHIATAMKRALR